MKASVIVPVYNGCKYLKASINSLLSQTHQDLEIIVIDDGSTEPVWDLLQTFKDSRIKIFKNEKNIGFTATLNKCLGHVTGDFIVRHDADDISRIDRIESQLKLFEPAVGFVGCWARSLTEKGLPDPVHYIDKQCRTRDSDLLFLYPRKLCVADPTFIFSKQAVVKVGFFDEFLFIGETYNYVRRIQRYFEGRMCTKVLYDRRRRPDSVMRTLPQKWKDLDLIRLCNKRADKYPVISTPGVVYD